MSRTQEPIRSALYEGQVTHVRTKVVGHSFTKRVSMCYFDLDDIEGIVAQHPFWSTDRWRPAQVREQDYGTNEAQPLSDVLRKVASQQVDTPLRKVRLLAYPRTWGWCFNPITLGFCFDPADQAVVAVVATVTNTPWGDRHSYVLPVGSTGLVDVRVAKAMHVSPFFSMDQTYRFRISPPGDTLRVIVDVDEGPVTVMRAELCLLRRSLDRRAMTRLLLRRRSMSQGATLAIYREAARLAVKGAIFYRHPTKIKSI